MTKQYIDPWGYFEMDDATGLPLLPEGHYWRVGPNYPTSPHVRVSIMRRGKRWGKDVEVCWGAGFRAKFNKSKLLDTAAHLLKYEFGTSDAIDLYGDYPPKKLGA